MNQFIQNQPGCFSIITFLSPVPRGGGNPLIDSNILSRQGQNVYSKTPRKTARRPVGTKCRISNEKIRQRTQWPGFVPNGTNKYVCLDIFLQTSDP